MRSANFWILCHPLQQNSCVLKQVTTIYYTLLGLYSGLWINATSGRTEKRGALSLCGHLCCVLRAQLPKFLPPGAPLEREAQQYNAMARPLPASRHCLENSLFLKCCLLSQNLPRHNGGQQEMGLFIQVPLSIGAALQVGLGSQG